MPTGGTPFDRTEPPDDQEAGIDFALTDTQREIREQVLHLCGRFDAAYWLERDRPASFPDTFFARLWPFTRRSRRGLSRRST